MAYSRYLDIFVMNSFSQVALQTDMDPAEAHQKKKLPSGGYRTARIDFLSVTRDVDVAATRDAILWVCAADGGGGKIRINAHGDACSLFNDRGHQIDIAKFTDYLVKHGLGAQSMGSPASSPSTSRPATRHPDPGPRGRSTRWPRS